jgi:GMP synthase-like glutamine amidotransferase
MNIHYIQHEPFEDLGCIRKWLQSKNYHVSHTHVWQGEGFPDPSKIDLLIIMGGSMSAYDDEILDWLPDEKKFIKACIDRNKKVIGICLGSQLLASVLGSKVYPGPQKEIGWFSVQLKDQITSSLFNCFPKEFATMHWHGDTFDLPQGAILMASSALTKHQAFLYNDRVVGLQFHPEMNEAAIIGMIDETGELKKAQYVQTVDEIKSHLLLCSENNKYMFQLLDKLVELK